MSTFRYPFPGATLDFSECEREAIHIPGHIQPHGVVVGVDASDGRVRYVSENAGNLIGLTWQKILGRSWSEVGGRLGLRPEILASDIPAGPAYFSREEKIAGTPVLILAHRVEGVAIWEFERPPADARAGEEAPSPGYVFDDRKNLYRTSQDVAEEIAALCGYDRVMVYRFHEDWTGEVIAEKKRPELTPYLGLRYPATDIPSQARELYRRNLLRMIVDVNSIPTLLLGEEGAEPLDLSHTRLRSVSPYHIEYLKNMGVVATLTISILVKGELWGMIACHHGRAHLMSKSLRLRGERLARGFGAWIEGYMVAQERLLDARIERDGEILNRLLGQYASAALWKHLLFSSHRIEVLLGADALAIVHAEGLIATGDVPDDVWLRAFSQWMLARPAGQDVYEGDRLPDFLPAPVFGQGKMCGILAAVIERTPVPTVICVFRGELEKEIHWGGDPARAAQVSSNQRIMPRDSFELWRQIVRGSSRPWETFIVRRMEALRDALRSKKESLAESLSHGLRELAGKDEGSLLEAYLGDEDRDRIAIFLRLQDGASPEVLGTTSRFNEMFGFDVFETIGQPVETLLARAGLAVSDFSEAKRREVWSPSLGHRTVIPSGHEVMRVALADNQYRLSVLVIRDVTADERLSEAVEAARRQALVSSEAKSALLANVSHELKTPLNAILGFSELMRADMAASSASSEHLEYTNTIMDASEHLLALVDDLLEAAKNESQAARSNASPFDLVSLAEEACLWLRPIAGNKGVIFKYALPPHPIHFLGEPVRLRQVMMNLFSNAVKFTPANGEVSCKMERIAGVVVFEVGDTGVGIPPQHLARVFDRFYQADASSTRAHGGAGLGLAIAKANIELHGGTIHISSREGIGTRVRVELPAARITVASDGEIG